MAQMPKATRMKLDYCNGNFPPLQLLTPRVRSFLRNLSYFQIRLCAVLSAAVLAFPTLIKEQ